jgi:hypothetical protein
MKEILMADTKKEFADPRDAMIYGTTVKCQELFEILQIPNFCCRMHLMTITDPMDPSYIRIQQ